MEEKFILGGIGAIGGILVLMRLFASKVYDVLICSMTRKWYAAVISRLGKQERVLDIGIGTATALLDNKVSVIEKELGFVGVDYDAQYIKFADSQIKNLGLDKQLRVHCKSVFDDDLAAVVKRDEEKQFDCAYFSGSWTLMPEPVKALRIAANLVKDDGKIYVTQTFQRQSTPFMGVIKPLLKYITTIDFGPLHYESDLQQYISEAEKVVDGLSLKVEENSVVPGSIDNRFQSARLIIFSKVFSKNN